MTARGTSFTETLLGTVRLDGEDRDRPVRLDLAVTADTLVRPAATTRASLSGRVRVQGWADDKGAEGELEISPLARRRIRYQLEFTTAAGRKLSLDGWKSLTALRPLRSMTVMPFTLYEDDGARAGVGTVRFPVATGLLPFLRSVRFPRAGAPAHPHAPRWAGEPGRTEVWYTSVSDPATGTGLWLHHELVSPADGSAAYVHGWIAAFPAAGPVSHARFGPEPWQGSTDGFTSRDVVARGGRLAGQVGDFAWEIRERAVDGTMFTFPQWSWRRQVLPAAHMLPAARSTYEGTVTYPGGTVQLAGAPGATARIYGRGNARRWAWLHAELEGGGVLEIIAAVSTRPVLRRLPPLVFLRLRQGSRTWPRRAERSAFGWVGLGRFRADIGTPEWTVRGRSGTRRIRVRVTQPPERTLTLEYQDPDGSTNVCRNSERADAEITVERWWGRWRNERTWVLTGTAHAEVGGR
ncbi:hypothetical protein ACWGIN_05075 [Streptomyces sp. NPDC054861]